MGKIDKKTYNLKTLSKENLYELTGYKFEDKFDIRKLLDAVSIEKMGFKYAIIYNYDSVVSSTIAGLVLDPENIIEARFFNESSEIRIFNDEGSFNGTIFSELENSDPICQKVILYPRYKEKAGYASKLEVKKYLAYDEEDSQAYISYVKPSKLDF